MISNGGMVAVEAAERSDEAEELGFFVSMTIVREGSIERVFNKFGSGTILKPKCH